MEGSLSIQLVPGSFNDKKSSVNLYCAVIVKTVDEKTRSKTSINELLRDNYSFDKGRESKSLINLSIGFFY